MKKITGTKRMLSVLMAILIALGTLLITDGKAYAYTEWDYFSVYEEVEGMQPDVFESSTCKSIRICPNEEARFYLHYTDYWSLKYTKIQSSSKKLSVKTFPEVIYGNHREYVCVTASEEGTYTIKYTVKISNPDEDEKRHPNAYTYTGETTVYVYDFNRADPENRHYLPHDLLEYTTFYMNGKKLKPASFGMIEADISKGRLTAKLDKSCTGITITKIKVYGKPERGGKKTSIKNAKKGKNVCLNSRPLYQYQYKEDRLVPTRLRVFYKDKYTGMTKVTDVYMRYKYKAK